MHGIKRRGTSSGVSPSEGGPHATRNLVPSVLNFYFLKKKYRFAALAAVLRKRKKFLSIQNNPRSCLCKRLAVP
jgi:hypothetical protein